MISVEREDEVSVLITVVVLFAFKQMQYIVLIALPSPICETRPICSLFAPLGKQNILFCFLIIAQFYLRLLTKIYEPGILITR